MSKDTIQYDDNGNFLMEGDVEVQWMKLHRDIQAEYRSEQWIAFLKGAACVCAIVVTGYLALTSFNSWMY